MKFEVDPMTCIVSARRKTVGLSNFGFFAISEGTAMKRLPALLSSSATFSACRKYRYTLWRNWGDLFLDGYAMFIGLNPSTADETNDDPTIRRCAGYARDWGYAGFCMGNLFALRATSPAVMKAAKDPIGPDNDRALIGAAESAGVIIAAWGVHGTHLGRDKEIRRMIPRLNYLKMTKSGHPAHPLYLLRGLRPVPFHRA